MVPTVRVPMYPTGPLCFPIQWPLGSGVAISVVHGGDRRAAWQRERVLNRVSTSVSMMDLHTIMMNLMDYNCWWVITPCWALGCWISVCALPHWLRPVYDGCRCCTASSASITRHWPAPDQPNSNEGGHNPTNVWACTVARIEKLYGFKKRTDVQWRNSQPTLWMSQVSCYTVDHQVRPVLLLIHSQREWSAHIHCSFTIWCKRYSADIIILKW